MVDEFKAICLVVKNKVKNTLQQPIRKNFETL